MNRRSLNKYVEGNYGKFAKRIDKVSGKNPPKSIKAAPNIVKSTKIGVKKYLSPSVLDYPVVPIKTPRGKPTVEDFEKIQQLQTEKYGPKVRVESIKLDTETMNNLMNQKISIPSRDSNDKVQYDPNGNLLMREISLASMFDNSNKTHRLLNVINNTNQNLGYITLPLVSGLFNKHFENLTSTEREETYRTMQRFDKDGNYGTIEKMPAAIYTPYLYPDRPQNPLRPILYYRMRKGGLTDAETIAMLFAPPSKTLPAPLFRKLTGTGNNDLQKAVNRKPLYSVYGAPLLDPEILEIDVARAIMVLTEYGNYRTDLDNYVRDPSDPSSLFYSILGLIMREIPGQNGQTYANAIRAITTLVLTELAPKLDASKRGQIRSKVTRLVTRIGYNTGVNVNRQAGAANVTLPLPARAVITAPAAGGPVAPTDQLYKDIYRVVSGYI